MTSHRSWARPVFAAILVGLAVYGCGGRGQTTQTFVARDSAGVRVVESRGAVWRGGQAWRLAAAPSLAIGVGQGDPRYELEGVRGAVRLKDGRIVVANGGSEEMRFYDRQGRFLLGVGRSGEGPGEFRLIRRLDLSRDSLWVYDAGLGRVSVFDTAGHFGRTLLLSDNARVVGQFADGALVAARLHLPDGATKPGLHTYLVTYYRLAPSGQVLDSLGVFPDDEEYLTFHPDGSYDSEQYLFGLVSAVAVGSSRLVFGTSATYRIAGYSEKGRLETVMERPTQPRPVTSQDLDSVIQRVGQHFADPDRRKALELRFRRLHHAATWPAYSQIRIDADGDIWVGSYELLRRPPVRWAVFDPRGVLLGEVAVPTDFTVYQIGADFVLGSRADSLGVQHVELYPLVKPEPQ